MLFQSSGLKELFRIDTSQRPRFNTRLPLRDEYLDINAQALIAMGEDVIQDIMMTLHWMHLPTSAMAVGSVRGTADASSEKGSATIDWSGFEPDHSGYALTESTILLIEANTASASLSADLQTLSRKPHRLSGQRRAGGRPRHRCRR